MKMEVEASLPDPTVVDKAGVGEMQSDALILARNDKPTIETKSESMFLNCVKTESEEELRLKSEGEKDIDKLLAFHDCSTRDDGTKATSEEFSARDRKIDPPTEEQKTGLDSAVGGCDAPASGFSDASTSNSSNLPTAFQSALPPGEIKSIPTTSQSASALPLGDNKDIPIPTASQSASSLPLGESKGIPTVSQSAFSGGGNEGIPTGSQSALPAGGSEGIPTGSQSALPAGGSEGIPTGSQSALPAGGSEDSGESGAPPPAPLVSCMSNGQNRNPIQKRVGFSDSAISLNSSEAPKSICKAQSNSQNKSMKPFLRFSKSKKTGDVEESGLDHQINDYLQTEASKTPTPNLPPQVPEEADLPTPISSKHTSIKQLAASLSPDLIKSKKLETQFQQTIRLSFFDYEAQRAAEEWKFRKSVETLDLEYQGKFLNLMENHNRAKEKLHEKFIKQVNKTNKKLKKVGQQGHLNEGSCFNLAHNISSFKINKH